MLIDDEEILRLINTAPSHLRFFELRGQHKPEYWRFIRLVAKDGVETPTISDHARTAWCLRCSKEIYYAKGNSGVREHMRYEHRDELMYFEAQVKKATMEKKKRKVTKADLDLEADHPAQKRTKISDANQSKFDKLVALWVASSMRPVCIVEDPGLTNCMKFLADVFGADFKMPKRGEVRSVISEMSEDLRTLVKARIVAACTTFSITTDLWTDRGLRSFIAVTLHYVDDNFFSHNWVLGVKHFPGMHDNVRISEAIQEILDYWKLKNENCVRLMRDGAENMVKAAKNLKIDDMSCVAHSLHLVVGGVMVRKPKRKQKSSEPVVDLPVEIAISGGEEVVTSNPQVVENVERLRENACEEVDDFVGESEDVDRQALDEVRDIVGNFRAVAVYFHRSSKAKNRLFEIQHESPDVPNGEELDLILDCPTRWNSTWELLYRFVQLKPYLKLFYKRLERAEGKKEFSDHRTLPRVEKAHWFAADCIRALLGMFAAVSKKLCGEAYPSLVLVVPCLRVIKRKLDNANIFDDVVAKAGDRADLRIVSIMQRVRMSLLTLFHARFRKLHYDLAWISVLDHRQTRMKLFSEPEREFARTKLVDALVAICSEPEAHETPTQVASPIPNSRQCASTPVKTMDELDVELFDSEDEDNSPPLVNDASDCDAVLRMDCDDEVRRYIEFTTKKVSKEAHLIRKKMPTLLWWRTNCAMFPKLRKLARKWFGCVATIPDQWTVNDTTSKERSSDLSVDVLDAALEDQQRRKVERGQHPAYNVLKHDLLSPMARPSHANGLAAPATTSAPRNVRGTTPANSRWSYAATSHTPKASRS